MKYIFQKSLVFVLIVLLVTSAVPGYAQATHDTYRPETRQELIAFLYGLIAALQSGETVQFGSHGRVLGMSDSRTRYDIDVSTQYVRYDDDEVYLTGTLDREDASYAHVWFEYGEDRDDLEERTKKVRKTSDGRFSIRLTDFDDDQTFYYRAAGESPSGHRSYGFTRFIYISSHSGSRGGDDEPEVDTDPARNIEHDEAELRGDVDMNDFRNGVVFFVYGEDEDQIEDVERDYDSYRDVDEDGDDLQKVRVDSDLDRGETYRRTVTNLDDDTEHYFQLCVEYEDEDDDETLECGGVEEFETDRD